MSITKDILPDNKQGKQNDLEATEVFDTHEAAKARYQVAVSRMLYPSAWHQLCGSLSATFILIDAEGKVLDRKASAGDYIRIDVPGPGPSSGDGYDWVKVEQVKEQRDGNEDQCCMLVRPSAPPTKLAAETAHFFDGSASSTFMIHRTGAQLIASYHGRNEKPNVTTEKAVDKVRNAAIAAAAMAGMSELQWKTLLDAFIKG